ncbi:PREDICTED: mediator of RNA polymerase II transcription subunit 8-like [Priapulus caudatus]|uniref:Mediator of RNA polymerase II transcription subunit 8 n=1 Tax=Priapulus caudatus TaxID=37621 RepID=A0ABM1E8G0_PRICU|nr:PREDICTED: mediator of RNA polymerase II transcription subunit 8-like [Priapulus caudatus]
MQREEKVLEATTDALVSRVQDLKNAIAAFLVKLETESEILTWPTVLDNFSLISSHVNTLSRLLKSDKTPALRNLALLPLLLQQEPDPELQKLTEERVPAFNHEVVPDYLRTKPEPDVEHRDKQLLARANQVAPENAQRQITSLNKISGNIIELVSNAKDEWESESGSKANLPMTYSQADTNALVSAVTFGKNLKQMKPPNVSTTPMTRPPDPSMQQGNPGKTQSSIKTSIKSASNVHPYSR